MRILQFKQKPFRYLRELILDAQQSPDARIAELEAAMARYREALECIERRGGSASLQSGYTDAHECAELARDALKGDA